MSSQSRQLSRTTSRTAFGHTRRLSLFLHHPTSSLPNLPLLAPEWPTTSELPSRPSGLSSTKPINHQHTTVSPRSGPVAAVQRNADLSRRGSQDRTSRTRESQRSSLAVDAIGAEGAVSYFSPTPGEKEIVSVALEPVSSNDGSLADEETSACGEGASERKRGRKLTRKWWKRSLSGSSKESDA